MNINTLRNSSNSSDFLDCATGFEFAVSSSDPSEIIDRFGIGDLDFDVFRLPVGDTVSSSKIVFRMPSFDK